MAYKDKEKQKEYYKAHKDDIRAYKRSWEARHKEERNAYHKVYNKAYHKEHTNSLGKTKNSVRKMSRDYLFYKLNHTKLENYQIHHCFGYDDYKCFIYIPRELHLQIHQYLRDNNINAESNHFTIIAHLINAWNGYTYIKV